MTEEEAGISLRTYKHKHYHDMRKWESIAEIAKLRKLIKYHQSVVAEYMTPEEKAIKLANSQARREKLNLIPASKKEATS